jgi:hypothetical protein
MSQLDPRLLRALRADAVSPPDPARLDRLAASIDAAAAPLLAERRRRQPEWWELPAAWAATLIPASLLLAAASIFVLWRVEPPRATREIAQAPVDQVINELIATPPR